MKPLDYSKWDNLEISDDEYEGSGPPPPAEPLEGVVERREVTLDAGRDAIRAHFFEKLEELDGSKRGRDDRALIAYFVAAQHRDEGATDNRERHVVIIDLLAKRGVLVADETTVALCSIARNSYDAKDEFHGKVAIEAVNTMEACRRYNGALALFEAICAPADDRARALLKAYAAHTFGELRLKRLVFSRVSSVEMQSAIEAHEAEVLKDIDPPPPARPPPKARCGGWLPWICAMTALGVGAHRDVGGVRSLPRRISKLLTLKLDDDDDYGEPSPLKLPGADADDFWDFPEHADEAVSLSAYAPPADFPGVSLEAGARVVVVEWDAGQSPGGDAYARVKTDGGAVGFAPQNLLERRDAAEREPAFPDL